MTAQTIAGWARGDVVTIHDPAHPRAICVLTTDALINEPTTWLLVDETCTQWRSTEWVEGRHPELIARKGAAA